MPNILHNRHPLRLKDYDYSQPGAYFVTICTWHRDLVFGSIFDGKLILNDNGRAVEKAWLDLSRHYHNVMVDEFIVMPDHFHGILFLIETLQEKVQGLSEIIRGFKSRSARQINLIRDANGVPVWQRGYYDRIIRNSTELDLVRRYIIDNPSQWEIDEQFPPKYR